MGSILAMMEHDTLLPKLVSGRRANRRPDGDWFHFLVEEFQNAETLATANVLLIFTRLQ